MIPRYHGIDGILPNTKQSLPKTTLIIVLRHTSQSYRIVISLVAETFENGQWLPDSELLQLII